MRRSRVRLLPPAPQKQRLNAYQRQPPGLRNSAVTANPPASRFHSRGLAADIDRRIEEWSRYVRSFGRRRRSCESIEGRFRSPQHREPPTIASQAAPIAWRAMQVEHAVIAQLDLWRLVLVVFYIRRLPLAAMPPFLRRFNVRDPKPVLA